MLLSKDQALISKIKQADFLSEEQLIHISEVEDPLDIVLTVCSNTPGLIIADDDLLKPDSARILKSIKRIRDNIYIIFITSDASISLGSEISQLGIQFYGLKPLDGSELIDSVQSIIRLKQKKDDLYNI